jgi:hypothetical protein
MGVSLAYLGVSFSCNLAYLWRIFWDLKRFAKLQLKDTPSCAGESLAYLWCIFQLQLGVFVVNLWCIFGVSLAQHESLKRFAKDTPSCN